MTHVLKRVVIDINLDVIAENYRKISERIFPLQAIAVLKADAYCLGMQAIAKELAACGVPAIAVANLHEALDAADFGVPVILLGTVLADELHDAVKSGIWIPVADIESAREINRTAINLGVKAQCHVAIDTGMGRLGVLAKDSVEVIREIMKMPGISIRALYSHFPMANVEDDIKTKEQIESLKNIVFQLKKDTSCSSPNDLTSWWISIANSDGITNYPSSLSFPFSHVRAGIGLYTSNERLGLKQAVTMRAHLAQIRVLPKGATIGYGRTYTCPHDMRVGTVAAGYADGIPQALSNRGSFQAGGKSCPIIGRVSMDYTTICLDGVENVKSGDEVICLGSGVAQIQDWADIKGTPCQDILCAVAPRAQHRYIKNGKYI